MGPLRILAVLRGDPRREPGLDVVPGEIVRVRDDVAEENGVDHRRRVRGGALRRERGARGRQRRVVERHQLGRRRCGARVSHAPTPSHVTRVDPRGEEVRGGGAALGVRLLRRRRRRQERSACAHAAGDVPPAAPKASHTSLKNKRRFEVAAATWTGSSVTRERERLRLSLVLDANAEPAGEPSADGDATEPFAADPGGGLADPAGVFTNASADAAAAFSAAPEYAPPYRLRASRSSMYPPASRSANFEATSSSESKPKPRTNPAAARPAETSGGAVTDGHARSAHAKIASSSRLPAVPSSGARMRRTPRPGRPRRRRGGVLRVVRRRRT